MDTLQVGTRVQISDGSGCESGTRGTVIPLRDIPTNGSGVPAIPGYYRPTGSDEVAIRADDGHLLTMFRNRVAPITPADEAARVARNIADLPGQCGDCGRPLERDEVGLCGIHASSARQRPACYTLMTGGDQPV